MPNPPCELLISPELLLTDPVAAPLTDASLAISAGHIVAVGPTAELRAFWQPKRQIILEQQLLMPGLINAQVQLAHRLLAANGSAPGSEALTLGVDLELLDLISAGITGIADTSLYPAQVAERCAAAGLRAQVTAPLASEPTPFSRSAAEAKSHAVDLFDEWRAAPLINVAFGPRSASALDLQMLGQIQALADELDAAVRLPLLDPGPVATGHATQMAELDTLGMWNPRLQLWCDRALSAAEHTLAGARGVSLIYCPFAAANPDPPSTIAQSCEGSGAHIALGTNSSGAISAALLLSAAQVALQLQPGTDSARVLQQVCGNGARALSMDASTTLVAGAPADLASFDLQAPALQPRARLHASAAHVLLRAGSTLRARNVWVAGEQLLSDGQHCTLNRTEILTRAGRWQATIPT